MVVVPVVSIFSIEMNKNGDVIVERTGAPLSRKAYIPYNCILWVAACRGDFPMVD